MFLLEVGQKTQVEGHLGHISAPRAPNLEPRPLNLEPSRPQTIPTLSQYGSQPLQLEARMAPTTPVWSHDPPLGANTNMAPRCPNRLSTWSQAPPKWVEVVAKMPPRPPPTWSQGPPIWTQNNPKMATLVRS